MLFSKIVTNKFGQQQKIFYLTQGDTATFESFPTKDGQLINFDLIEKCLFKISDSDYKEILQKEFDKGVTKFTVTLESEDTFNLPVDKLIYEVEYTFIDGTVNTPNQGTLQILDQVRE